jgi:hypothetical protein
MEAFYANASKCFSYVIGRQNPLRNTKAPAPYTAGQIKAAQSRGTLPRRNLLASESPGAGNKIVSSVKILPAIPLSTSRFVRAEGHEPVFRRQLGARVPQRGRIGIAFRQPDESHRETSANFCHIDRSSALQLPTHLMVHLDPQTCLQPVVATASR